MKKLLLSSLISLLFFAQSPAQEFPWNAYFGGQGADFARDIRQTADQGYIVAGYGGDGNASNYYVVKLDLFGDLQWQRNLNKDNYSEKAYNVLETPQGEYIIVGSATSGNRPWIVKLDQNGETIWTSEWTDQAPNNSALLAHGTLLPDGRIVVVGAEGQYGSQPNMFIVGADGQLIEQRSLVPIVPPGWLAGTYVNHIESTADGGFVMTGTAGSATASRAFLWKFDANADSSWVQHYTTSNAWMRSAEHVSQLADGGFLLTGIDAPNGNNSCAIRTDSQGNFLWYQSYSDTLYTHATAGIEMPDGQLWFTEKRYDGIGTTFFQSAMIKTDASGNLISRAAIMASDSSTAITNMVKTNDGGFVLAGEINEYLSVNEQDLFVLKSDALGNISGVLLDYVWPGDVNYDGEVSMDDLMILGVTSGGSGPERWNASISWTPQYVTDWADTVVTGVNFKHADTDGNGIIAIDDTLAIVQNYGLSRNAAQKNHHHVLTGQDLYVLPNEAVLVDNQKVMIPVYLGSEGADITNLYGLQFSLILDDSIVDIQHLKLDFDNSWLGNTTEELWSMVHRQNGLADIGITRSNQQPVSGSGLLAMLSFWLNEPLEPGASTSISITFTNLKAHSLDLQPINLLTDTFEVLITNSITKLPEVQVASLSISPNPSTGTVNIHHLLPGAQLRVYSMSGYMVLQMVAGSTLESIRLDKPGMYVIESIDGKGIKRSKVLIQ